MVVCLRSLLWYCGCIIILPSFSDNWKLCGDLRMNGGPCYIVNLVIMICLTSIRTNFTVKFLEIVSWGTPIDRVFLVSWVRCRANNVCSWRDWSSRWASSTWPVEYRRVSCWTIVNTIAVGIKEAINLRSERVWWNRSRAMILAADIPCRLQVDQCSVNLNLSWRIIDPFIGRRSTICTDGALILWAVSIIRYCKPICSTIRVEIWPIRCGRIIKIYSIIACPDVDSHKCFSSPIVSLTVCVGRIAVTGWGITISILPYRWDALTRAKLG